MKRENETEQEESAFEESCDANKSVNISSAEGNNQEMEISSSDSEDNTVSNRNIQNNMKLGASGNINENALSDDVLNSALVSKVSNAKAEIIETTKNGLTKLQKKRIIERALKDDDYKKMKEAALGTWGLLDDEMRKKCWPRLAGADVFETSPRPSNKEIENHPYYNQVVLDVNRSLKRFPPSIEEKQRLAMQDQLILLIMRVLMKHPNLHYYQGYHDICVTFLLVLGEEISFTIVEKLSISHLRVFMDKTMVPTQEMLSYIYPLIRQESIKLYEFLVKSEAGIIFCLSWLITWFGHVLNKYNDVVRLFDLFLVSHPWMPIYMSAAIVLHRKDEVLNVECDMANVHSLLSNIPENLPLEDLIKNARKLLYAYPPQLLKKYDQYRVGLPRTVSRPPKTMTSRLFGMMVTYVPRRKWKLSVVVAIAVLVCAVLYQKYKS